MHQSTEEIWQQMSAQLKTFIRTKVSNPATAEDILQNVFLKIHSSIDKLKDKNKIRSWVYTITRNAIIDFYRQKDINTEDLAIPELESPSPCASPTDEVAAGIKGMIESLPEKYAQALLLVEFGGLSQIELAERIGISISGAKSRVQKARTLLKQQLMQCCHFEFDRFGTIIDHRPNNCTCCHANN